MAIGRNSPCPCGSGKKYKHCCLRKGQTQPSEGSGGMSSKFRFESGSYGDFGRGFFPSIICYVETQSGTDTPHFCLANTAKLCVLEDEADTIAHEDLEIAFAAKQSGGTDEDVAMVLKKAGYVSVEGFNRSGFNSPKLASYLQF